MQVLPPPFAILRKNVFRRKATAKEGTFTHSKTEPPMAEEERRDNGKKEKVKVSHNVS
jgi:hypothetical protein